MKLRAVIQNRKISECYGIEAKNIYSFTFAYGAGLAGMNIGDTFTTGPKQAAYVINDLVQPKAVIASHANEPATSGGKVQDGTRTALFRDSVNVPVHVPLSGRTMAFNSMASCISGCN